jgi:RecB family endonuclease NucS
MRKDDEVVVVDFKFGKPNPEYNEQVERYMKLLREMGYKQVRGYLWYVYRNTLGEIK